MINNAPMQSIYTEQLPLWSISVIRADNGQLEQLICNDWERPADSLIESFRKQWTTIHIHKLDRFPISAPPLHRKDIPIQRVQIQKKNREHLRAHIILCEETTCTCPATGISWIARLPSPQGTNYPVHHPFAIATNSLSALVECSKHGVFPHDRYERQVLAGMLIAILGSHGLVACKDTAIANLYLQRCSGPTLSLLLTYLAALRTYVGLPALSLNDVAYRISETHKSYAIALPENAGRESAEILLLNYLRDLKAARSDKRPQQTGLGIPTRKPSTGIKVYSDPTKAEQVANKDAKRSIADALKIVKAKYLSSHAGIILKLEFNLKTIQFLSSMKRATIVGELRSLFPNDLDIATICNSISNISLRAIDEDLIGFSDTIHSEITAKLDLKAILAKKGIR